MDEVTGVGKLEGGVRDARLLEGGAPQGGVLLEDPWWHAAIPCEPGDVIGRLARAEQAMLDGDGRQARPTGDRTVIADRPRTPDRPPAVTWNLTENSPTLAERLRDIAAHRTAISRVCIGVLSLALVASAVIGMSASRHARSVQRRLTSTTARLDFTAAQLATVTAQWQRAEINFKTATSNYATDEAQIAALSQQIAALQAQLPSPRFAAPAP